MDNAIIKALNSLASQESTATENAEKNINQFLEYLATNPDPKIRHFASDMLLTAHSDAACVNELKAKSTAAGYCWLRNKTDTDKRFKNNGAIHVLIKIIKLACSSAAESELAALFINAQEAIPLRQTLIDLDHPQPPIEIIADNSIASGIANQTVKQNKLRSMNMRYFRLTDQSQQKLINVRWKPGEMNLANYFTKHFTGPYHKKVRPYYSHEHDSPTCIRNLPNPRKFQTNRKSCKGVLSRGMTTNR